MHVHRTERFVVRTHLLAEPCLWCWEILDTEADVLVEGSWATEWIGYESAREALEAGIARLDDLARSGGRPVSS